MSYVGGYGGYSGYGNYGFGYGYGYSYDGSGTVSLGYGYYYDGGYSSYGELDASVTTSDTEDSSITEIIVHAPKQDYSYTQYYLTDASFENTGGSSDSAKELSEEISTVISKLNGGIEAAINVLPESQEKTALEKIHAGLDLLEKAEQANTLSTGDLKDDVALIIDTAISNMSGEALAETVAAIVGAIGAETGPADVALASAAGAAAYLAYASLPTETIASDMADVIVDGIVKVAGTL